MAPRYTIVPGTFCEDSRADLMHFRVLEKLGSHTDAHGWCRLKQSGIAEKLGCRRETVNRKIRDLVEWGYVARHVADASGRAIYYRVIMDRGEPPPETTAEPVDDGETDLEFEQLGLPLEGGSGDAPQLSGPVIDNAQASKSVSGRVRAPVTPGVIARDHSKNDLLLTTNKDNPPYPPKGGTGQIDEGDEHKPRSKAEGIIAALSHDVAAPVLAHLIGPVLKAKRYSDADPVASLRQIAQAASGLTIDELRTAARYVVQAEVATVKATRLLEAIATVRKYGASWEIRPDMPEWHRWLDHYRNTGQWAAAHMPKASRWLVPSQWPPTNSGGASK